jgi:putative heme-binding domain-containing protein
MRWSLALLVAFLFISPLAAQDPYGQFIAGTQPRTPEEERKSFHLPQGFEIELLASEPAIIKPINMNFDDRGRLWVTQSVEYPFPAPKGQKPRDVVKILEDSDGDGKADKVTTFADELNIPIGVLPLRNGAFVYSIPNIWGLYDTKGAGYADKREILYGAYGYRDTHGMTGSFTWGFDGWIYACHGFSNTSLVKARDGSVVEMTSGNTYRLRADGSHVEQFTHGQVNPFGLTFDPLGNLYSADCHTKPVMMLLRGGYYDSFGKPHDGLGYAPNMCEHDHGSTAIAGIVYYASDQFPVTYHDHVFLGNVVTNRINHDRLEKHGSTLKAIEQPDFLTCDDPWFRPVDLKLGPDGAIYVADFYNRIIGHYEVPLTHPGRDHERGRIWRIVYRGADGKMPGTPARADWNKATIGGLIADLAHPNLVVRMKAANQLAERGDAEIVPQVHQCLESPSAFTRMHGLWVLERLHDLKESEIEAAAHDADSGVRIHAMRILAGRPRLGPAQMALARSALHDSEPFVQRAAVEALGAHSSPDNLVALLALRHVVPADDTHLLYLARKALRDQLLEPAAWKMVAEHVHAEADHRAIADIAPGIPSAEAAAYLAGYLRRYAEDLDHELRYIHHVARHAKSESVRDLPGYLEKQHANDLPRQAAYLRAFLRGTQERGKPLEGKAIAWAEELVMRLLKALDHDTGRTGAELAGALHLASAQESLRNIAQDKEQPVVLRTVALESLVAIDAKRNLPELGKLLADSQVNAAIREQAARLLASLNQEPARAELIRALPIASESLQNVIASALAGAPVGARDLVKAIAAGKASARLLQEWNVHIQISKYPELKDEVERLTHSLPPADKRLRDLIASRHAGFTKLHGSAEKGAQVFEKNCAICHQIAGRGAKVGPQLDGVGNRGLDRLLEDIIDPNRNVDLAFRASTVALKSGQVLTGLVLREEGEVLVLADSQGKEQRVLKGDVEGRSPTQLSPMPANLAEQITEADFYHLMAYLLAQKPKAGAK